jgi:hypothetical protein
LAHLTAFFGEVPVPAIEAFAAERGIRLEDLRRGYEAVWMKGRCLTRKVKGRCLTRCVGTVGISAGG